MTALARTLICLLVTIALCVGSVSGEDFIDVVDKGNEAAKIGDYKKALEQYHIAETDIPESSELAYNIAGALAGLGSYEEALANYEKALNTTDIGLEAKAWANIGRTHFQMGDYMQSIESYQKALEINPDDVDSKFSLELARKMLKENAERQQQDQDGQGQQQQQQQNQQQDQQDQQEEQEEQPPEENEQENQGEQGDQDGQSQQPQTPEEQAEQEQQQAASQSQQMSKEDAERILNAFDNDEQEVQKQIRRQKASATYTGKDW